MRSGWDDAALHARDPLTPLARILGCTTGQAWSVVVSGTLALSLLTAAALHGPGFSTDSAAVRVPAPLHLPAGPATDGGLALPTQVPAEVPMAATPPELSLGLLGPPPGAEPNPVPFAAPPFAPPPLGPLPQGPPTGDSTPAPSPAGTSTAVTPLRIVEAGWNLPTGSHGSGVPDGAVAVQARLGADSGRAFLRLAGSDRTLTLPVDAEPGASLGADLAVLSACTTADPSWVSGPAQGTPPPFAAGSCVAGTLAPDGSAWSFDLAGLADPTGRAGVTIVVTPGAAPTSTFRLVLLTSEETP